MLAMFKTKKKLPHASSHRVGLHRRGDPVYPRPQATGQTSDRAARQSDFRRRDAHRNGRDTAGQRAPLSMDHHWLGHRLGHRRGRRATGADDGHAGDGCVFQWRGWSSPVCSSAGWNITIIRRSRSQGLCLSFGGPDWRSDFNWERSCLRQAGGKSPDPPNPFPVPATAQRGTAPSRLFLCGADLVRTSCEQLSHFFF